MKKQAAYPSKVTLNLAMREKSQFAPAKLVPLLLILIVLAGLFGKFAVADRLAKVDRAQAELLCRRFQAQPERIYNQILSQLLEEKGARS